MSKVALSKVDPGLFGLYFIPPEVDEALQIRLVVQALESGAGTVQLRLKHRDAADVLRIAHLYRSLTLKHDALLIVNDRVDIALACGADGVHLGQSDLPCLIARKITTRERPDLVIGVSATGPGEALAAVEDGADYIGAGPVFPTGSKDDAATPIGLQGLASICSAVTVPVVAIGGISLEHVAPVLGSGADGVAVISAIAGAPDPGRAARALYSAVKSAGRIR